MSDTLGTPVAFPKATANPATEYIILELDGGVTAGAWHERGRSSGTSAESAIRSLIKDQGTYIAVPLRSWRPTTVRTETTTRIIVEAS